MEKGRGVMGGLMSECLHVRVKTEESSPLAEG